MVAKKSAKKAVKKAPAKKAVKKAVKNAAKKIAKKPAKKTKKAKKAAKRTVRKIPALTKLEQALYQRMVQLDLLAVGADLTEELPVEKKAKKAKKR